MPESKICQYCGKTFQRTYERPGNWLTKRYCDRRCGTLGGKESKLKVDSKSNKAIVARRINAEGKRKRPDPPRKFIEHDAEIDHPANVAQRKLDREIDHRFDMPLNYRHIDCNHPEFADLCKQCCPIERVKQSQRIVGIYSEIEAPPVRRNENINEGRG